MVAMYALMQAGYGPFSFSTDEDVAADLMEYWFQLAGTGAERWPARTATRDLMEYSFSLRHAFRKIIDFTWADYRGDALVRHSSFGDDVKALSERARQSTLIMLCMPAEHLTNNRSAVSVTSSGRMSLILSMIRDKQSARLPPVVVVITKHDQIQATMSPLEVGVRVREVLGPLFAPDGGWHVAICPVSLGREIAGDKDGGMIEPYNMHLPVFFAADSILRRYTIELDSQMARRQSTAASLGSNAIKRWWNTDSIAYLQSANDESSREISGIRTDMARMMQDLKTLMVFENGVEIRPYD
jgi:hypothetical protein